MTLNLLIVATCALLGSAPPIVAAKSSSVTAAPRTPAARVADLAWLAGSWEGEGIGGGKATEVYSSPAGRQIVGHFRQSRPDGSVSFYEMITIVEINGTLEYRLKHFKSDLTAWEEKAEVVRFPLIAVEKDSWLFDGLTIQRDGPDKMVGRVRVSDGQGGLTELVFRYRRNFH